MTKSFKIVAAAMLFSSAALTGAMAQSSNQGDYYQGVDPNASVDGTTIGGGIVPVVVPGGEGAYYQGIDRMPQVDRMSTGSIDTSNSPATFSGGDGEYYKGAEKPMAQ
ncbi:hypothetical protein [Pararhizobium sp.]|uniref:hypothetical protein n=1 Tax=Pararhizobium sp. TaxID=1977563 RepID=UPI0027281BF2|nr:hypothetical protein [Pararhizobium sp.]MDO9418809.1 hypothetical protein [Pararhizobium sp.]